MQSNIVLVKTNEYLILKISRLGSLFQLAVIEAIHYPKPTHSPEAVWTMLNDYRHNL